MASASMFNPSVRYCIAAATYGAVRKAVYLRDAKVNSRDYSCKEPVPMLFTHKLAIVGVGSISAIYVWPYYLYNDMCNMEILLTKKNNNDYFRSNGNTLWLDYLAL